MSHVIFFLHGFDGRPREFNQMLRNFSDKFGARVKLHACASFAGQTHNGGGAGAKLVAAEMEVAMRQHHCNRLSVVCHSFGGVVMAWALRLLEDAGRLVGVALVNYVACATPFLGIRGSVGGQVIGGLLKLWCKSLREMCLCDDDFEGSKLPFLRRVAQPDVLEVLGRFRRRALYACVQGDLQVGYESAALQPCCADARTVTRSSEWPHITEESAHGSRDHRPTAAALTDAMSPTAEAAEAAPRTRRMSSLAFLWPKAGSPGSSGASPATSPDVGSQSARSPATSPGGESSWLMRDAKRELIREILSGYHTLAWERVDCVFGYATGWGDLLAAPFAHEQIVGKVLGGMMEDARGKDVIDHLITRFEAADGGEAVVLI